MPRQLVTLEPRLQPLRTLAAVALSVAIAAGCGHADGSDHDGSMAGVGGGSAGTTGQGGSQPGGGGAGGTTAGGAAGTATTGGGGAGAAAASSGLAGTTGGAGAGTAGAGGATGAAGSGSGGTTGAAGSGSGGAGRGGSTGGGGAAGSTGAGGVAGGPAGGGGAGGGGGQAGVTGFVTRQGTQFMLNGKRYTFVGANFWAGMNLGAQTTNGDRARLVRELDHLQALGVTNVRMVAASEGPDTAPYRIVPSLMPMPGVYNEQVFQGLDTFLDELGKRGMRAVMILNNYWEWTGGMGQYVSWSDGSTIPDRIADSTKYAAFTQYVDRFYACTTCQTRYRAHIQTLINRVNTANGKKYREDPVIFAWQLANEPRDYPSNWVGDTAQYIKSLDPNHMVSVGSEGTWASNTSGTAANNFFISTHNSPYVDYATCHIWVEPWSKYTATDSSAANLQNATTFATGYLQDHDTLAKSSQVGKPLVLEEFGLARDGWAAGGKYDPASPTTNRDKYYKSLYAVVEASLAASGNALAGDNFWAWGGEARPPSKWAGDPPHETSGWFSVYDADTSTTAIISTHAATVTH